jgi:hypothetical protein
MNNWRARKEHSVFGCGLERDNRYNPQALLAGSRADGKKRNASKDKTPGTRDRPLELACIDARYNYWEVHAYTLGYPSDRLHCATN